LLESPEPGEVGDELSDLLELPQPASASTTANTATMTPDRLTMCRP
jgi:hypothetical protein